MEEKDKKKACGKEKRMGTIQEGKEVRKLVRSKRGKDGSTSVLDLAHCSLFRQSRRALSQDPFFRVATGDPPTTPSRGEAPEQMNYELGG